MFPGQSVVLTWFSRWFKLLVGITIWDLQVWTWLVKICLLVVASPSIPLCHSKIPSDWTPQSPLQFPVLWGQNRAFHNAREFWLSYLGSLFPLKEPVAHGRKNHMILHWPGGEKKLSTCSSFSYPSNAVCFVFCDTGGASASLPCFMILSVVLHWWIVVILRKKEEQSQEIHTWSFGGITPLKLNMPCSVKLCHIKIIPIFMVYHFYNVFLIHIVQYGPPYIFTSFDTCLKGKGRYTIF